MEAEVRVVARQLFELLLIEHFTQRTSAIPEADLTLAAQALKLIKNVRAHRRHPGAPADKDHFGVGLFGKELTKRTGDGDLITRFQRPDIRRHDPRRRIRYARRRRGDTHVEHDDALLFRVVGHGVGAQRRLFDLRDKAEQVEFIPVTAVFVRNVKVFVRDSMRRAFNLNVAARTERHIFAIGNAQLQLFNEGGFVIVGDNFTLPLFHAEDLLRQFNLHVLAHCHLTGQTTALFRLTLANVRQLGRQNIPAALFDRDPALPAGTAAAAGRRDKNAIAGKRVQQLVTCRGADLLIRLIVNLDDHIAGVHQL